MNGRGNGVFFQSWLLEAVTIQILKGSPILILADYGVVFSSLFLALYLDNLNRIFLLLASAF